MTDWLNFISEYISNNFNAYYILPFILAFMVLYVQLKKGNKYILSLTFFTFEIFSITTSVEYILIFIFTESLPKSIALLDKIILILGTFIAFLVIFHHATEGTRIGYWIDNILYKYCLSPTPMSISPFIEQLQELKSARDNIMTQNKDQVNSAYQVFLENGSSIMTSITKNGLINDEEIKQIEILFDNCKKDFGDMCDYQIFDLQKIVKTSGSISEFIGSVDGITKQFN